MGNPGQGDTRDPSFDSHLIGVENTRILSSHTLRFGWEGRLLRVDDTESGASTGNFSFSNAITQGPNPNAASGTAGNGIASLLLGVGSGSMLIDSKDAATQSHYIGAFIQDNWKVTRKLTLNLGLRYDLDIPRTERYNRMETFDPYVPSPLAAPSGISGLTGGTVFVGVGGNSRRQFDPQWHNFDPRFGFAWQPAANTVIRGGYGIFYSASLRVANATIGNEGFSAATDYVGSPDGLTPSVYLSNPFPAGLNHPAGSSQGLLTGICATPVTRRHSGGRLVCGESRRAPEHGRRKQLQHQSTNSVRDLSWQQASAERSEPLLWTYPYRAGIGSYDSSQLSGRTLPAIHHSLRVVSHRRLALEAFKISITAKPSGPYLRMTARSVWSSAAPMNCHSGAAKRSAGTGAAASTL